MDLMDKGDDPTGLGTVTGGLGGAVQGIVDKVATAAAQANQKPQCSAGYASPAEAMKGPPEKLLYIPCIQTKPFPDYLATIDVDPESPTFQQVIYRTEFPFIGDEPHHTGWNACSSCDGNVMCRDKLIMPCLGSDRIYIIDMAKDPKKPELFKIIGAEEMHKFGLASPHTPHCLPTGEIMISTMGNPNGDGLGSFLMLDSRNHYKPTDKGTYSSDTTKYGYDFWYQPYFGVMVSTEWGKPAVFKKGFDPKDLGKQYGQSIHIWNWGQRKKIQDIFLGDSGHLPLEVRFLHNPRAPHAYVGCAISSTVFHIGRNESETDPSKKWFAKKCVAVKNKKVKNWVLPELPGVVTDILISMDDKRLFLSNWLQGDIRCYDLSDPDAAELPLLGQAFVGGVVDTKSKVQYVDEKPRDRLVIKGRTIHGGPQMLQLSLDGTRLYTTTSLFSPWDKEFYPDLIKYGSVLLQLNVTPKGELFVNKNFLVDFGKEPNGPVLAHEIRYPGGDCTSDIFLSCGIDSGSTGGRSATQSAETSENVAETSENVAETSEDVAENSENVAETSEAETSENVAETSKNVAETSENVAKTSENVAETSGNVAETSENAAETP